MKRWVSYVDIEGFHALYKTDESRALSLLGGLMGDLFTIGSEVFPCAPERLFAHQVVDGFIVCHDIGFRSPDKPIAVAIALMRSALVRGGCLKAGMAYGHFADVTGCYPDEVMSEREEGRVGLGDGLMTIFPVMGLGHMDAYALSSRAHGPLLVLDRSQEGWLEDSGMRYRVGDKCVEVDWVHSAWGLATAILTKLHATAPPAEPEELLAQYLDKHETVPENWKGSAQALIRGYPSL